MTTASADGHDHDQGHPKHLAHHFDSLEQQYESNKFGMWAFLLTEILFFTGLFVIYANLRTNDPEIFSFAANYLDTSLGAINTIVLLLSSFTAAMAVRNAQLGETGKLKINLIITLLCAGAFMGIKAKEYTHKWDAGLLWPGAEQTIFKDDAHRPHEGHDKEFLELQEKTATMSPAEATHFRLILARFFGIYFFLTGLHGIHVLIGMVLFAWLFWRTSRGHFGPDNFTAIDLGALYWHLVDLIWIFLFPLLYLIS
jgi:cytochrome c oxidase subunit III